MKLYDITNQKHEAYIDCENAYIRIQLCPSTTSAILFRSTSCAAVRWENARQNKSPLNKKNNGIHMAHHGGFKNTMVS